jgi:hypothetical protein
MNRLDPKLHGSMLSSVGVYMSYTAVYDNTKYSSRRMLR